MYWNKKWLNWYIELFDIRAIVSPDIEWNTFIELSKSIIVLHHPIGCPVMTDKMHFHLEMLQEEYERWTKKGLKPEEDSGAFIMGLDDRVNREYKGMKTFG